MPRSCPVPTGENKTILLLESDADVLAVLTAALKARAYTVLESTHALEAVTIAQNRDGPIDAFISDVTALTGGAIEVLRCIRSTHPQINVILISGYGPALLRKRYGDIFEQAEFVQKPFSFAHLIAMLNRFSQRSAIRNANTLPATRL